MINTKRTRFVTTAKLASELPKREWNELAGENAFASTGWLRTVESTLIETPRPLYFLCHGHQQLLGAAVCYVQQKGGLLPGVDGALLGRFRHLASALGVSFRPVLACSAIHTPHCPFIIRKDLASSERRNVLESLVAEIEDRAFSLRLSAAFSTASEDHELNRVLQRRGYLRARDVPDTYLDIEWESFSEFLRYLKRVSPNKAKSARREINKNLKSGVSIQDAKSLDGYEESLMRLLELNHLKYNDGPFIFKASFLSQLKQNLGEDAIVKMAIKGSKPVGVTLTLTSGTVSSLVLVGIDHELSKNDLTYFNLAIYEQIKQAISSGVKRMYLGQGGYGLKIRRGCKVVDTHTFLKPVNLYRLVMARLWLPILSAWIRAKLPSWVRRNNEIDPGASEE